MGETVEAVAVVGVGCRLPGRVRGLDDLWRLLVSQTDAVGSVPPDRFDAAAITAPRTPSGAPRPGTTYTAAGAFLEEDLALFDADYFGISPKEASRLDPQQRLLLECAVEALDDAGIRAGEVAGTDTAVVVGSSAGEYLALQGRDPQSVNPYTMLGNAGCNVANRLSHFLDLRGPSYAVDTACASALTAVHEACHKIRSGECATALAGGASVILGPLAYQGFAAAQMLSPTGRCRPFSADADGYVRAEGAGIVVLKALSRARAAGDRIHAVIVAGGANADGRTPGLALPSARAQADLLRRVYTDFGIDPAALGYVEAHGTGTPAGDPVECASLGEVLGMARGGRPLPIGSVKSNLGHLEAASGIAGLLKAILVAQRGRIPATLHAGVPNPAIDFAALGLAPVTREQPLVDHGQGPLVGVNSFGFGGTNVHLVLAADAQDHRPPATPAPGEVPSAGAAQDRRRPLVISARTPAALAQAAGDWADRLEALDPADRPAFDDLAYTSACRRTGHRERAAVWAEDAGQAATALRALAAGGGPGPDGAATVAVERAVGRGRVAFAFAGAGAQWVGMGRELLSVDRHFAAEVRAVDEALRPHLGWSVADDAQAGESPTVRGPSIICQ
ncbi:beta-ketoacyl synthase N-terminal-like domain-containing protein [Kitasatospora sp. LaBMicrA B282]|uniref:beta-ketoacyl synthase N-terminal-like domain-containing protein n=1 Tax=Kitasatospora sp. LaBMicrA B282 TaxID=3420949 RepID=UPI003D0F37E0